MAVESPASLKQVKPALSNPNDNMVPIDSPLGKAAPVPAAVRLREAEEDLARLQDELMDVLEENQQLRMELEAWRTGARVPAQQAS